MPLQVYWVLGLATLLVQAATEQWTMDERRREAKKKPDLALFLRFATKLYGDIHVEENEILNEKA